MIIRYTDKEFKKAKSRDLLQLECNYCKQFFLKQKRYIVSSLNGSKNDPCLFCSLKCKNESRKLSKELICNECGHLFVRQKSQIRSEKSFCSRSCSGRFNNRNKKHGIRRSKLEIWIEQKLKEEFANIEIHYNRRDAINSELDIYIPDLNLAFELNGIFHYEPIFGQDKLSSIKNNDNRKFQACLEKGIELCIIDTRSMKYFKKDKAEFFFNIIKNIMVDKFCKPQA